MSVSRKGAVSRAAWRRSRPRFAVSWNVDRRTAVQLAAITVLAIVVRALSMGSRLHVDDAYSWLVASQPSPHSFLRQLAATENTPPLGYLMLVPLPIDHPAWLRLPAFLAGVLQVPALYWVGRRAFGARPALLAALAAAVAPFLITDSDLARGFMFEDLMLLLALGAVLRLLDGPSRRAAAVYVTAGVLALYTEYTAAVFLLALALAAVLVGRVPWRRMAGPTALVFVALVPWIPQIVRAQHQLGKTKVQPPAATTSARGLRDAVLTLTLGESGGTSNAIGRWLAFAVLLALLALAAWVVRRSRAPGLEERRRALSLVSLTGCLTLLGHAIAPSLGIHVFNQRYLTMLIPLGALVGAAALLLTGPRWSLVAAVALLALGLVEIARRYHGEYEPSFAPVRQAALAAHPRTILTDTPLVSFYLHDERVVLDRPSNLGPGLAGSCARPCLIVDDTRVPSGTPRAVIGPRTAIGPYRLSLER